MVLAGVAGVHVIQKQQLVFVVIRFLSSNENLNKNCHSRFRQPATPPSTPSSELDFIPFRADKRLYAAASLKDGLAADPEGGALLAILIGAWQNLRRGLLVLCYLF